MTKGDVAQSGGDQGRKKVVAVDAQDVEARKRMSELLLGLLPAASRPMYAAQFHRPFEFRASSGRTVLGYSPRRGGSSDSGFVACPPPEQAEREIGRHKRSRPGLLPVQSDGAFADKRKPGHD